MSPVLKGQGHEIFGIFYFMNRTHRLTHLANNFSFLEDNRKIKD